MVSKNEQYDEAKRRLDQAEEYYEQVRNEKARKSAVSEIRRYSKKNTVVRDLAEIVRTEEESHTWEKSKEKKQERVLLWLRNRRDVIIYIGAAIGGLLIGMLFANFLKYL